MRPIAKLTAKGPDTHKNVALPVNERSHQKNETTCVFMPGTALDMTHCIKQVKLPGELVYIWVIQSTILNRCCFHPQRALSLDLDVFQKNLYWQSGGQATICDQHTYSVPNAPQTTRHHKLTRLQTTPHSCSI